MTLIIIMIRQKIDYIIKYYAIFATWNKLNY